MTLEDQHTELKSLRTVTGRTADWDALAKDRARIQMGRISGFGLMEISRQRRRLGVIEGADGSRAEVPYALRGRLAGGLLGGMRFSDSGTLKLPEPLKTPR